MTDIIMRRGICQICGRHQRDLRILMQADFVGWVCEECMAQLGDSQVRKYCRTGEETEPGE